jgi:hypothetical protein
MILKDLIKKVIKDKGFNYLVDTLTESKGSKDLTQTHCYKNDFEDALLEILTTRPSKNKGVIQSVGTTSGIQNFYITEEPELENLCIASVSWADMVECQVKYRPLDENQEPKPPPHEEMVISIVREMTALAFSQKKINSILREL